jgi:hypothetical protein
MFYLMMFYNGQYVQFQYHVALLRFVARNRLTCFVGSFAGLDLLLAVVCMP